NGSRQHDAKADHRAYVERAVGMEKHATGGDVSGFGEIFMRVRCAYRDGKSEWKTYRASGISRAQARDGSFDLVHPCTSDREATPIVKTPQDYFGIRSTPEGHALAPKPQNGLKTWLLQ